MSRSRPLRFFLTQEQPCSYLEERTSQSLCLDPAQPVNGILLGALTRSGFRRSGQLVYRPDCRDCNACIPARIAVSDFHPSSAQRRTGKRGARLEVIEQPPALTDEYYLLYQRYIGARHADGSMYPPSPQQFQDFLAQQNTYTRFFEFRLQGRLLAVAVSDLLPDGLSAVYSFFDPDDTYFSLGRYCILWQIEYTRQLGLPHLYLGYWIRNCQKMRYKADYQPLQILQDEQWQNLESPS